MLAATASPREDREKEAPLRDDIRLLGGILGEVILDQAGPRVFELVESTRREAFAARRSGASEDQLAARLDGLEERDALHSRPASRKASDRIEDLRAIPLNHLQVTLLRRWRGGDRGQLVQRGIQLTLNGLATGLRNTG